VLVLPKLRNDQLAIVQHPAKIKVLSMGRRWGKTVMSGMVVMNVLRQHGRAAWIAPTYKNSRPLWRWAVNTVAPTVKTGHMSINKADRIITTRHGGELAIYSGDNIDSIRGEAFNLVVLDEAAKLSEDAWSEAIMPTLADYDGDAILISTPRGRNWFYLEYLRAQTDGTTAAAWQAPTTDNPLPNIRKAAGLAKLRVPEMSYRQEWLAEFLESSGVFRRITEAATAMPLDAPLPGRAYVAGVDVANEADFTVIVIMDAGSREMVHMDRFNRVGYVALEDRIEATARRWGLQTLVIEDNSIGRPVIDHLWGRGLPIVPFHTSGQSKGPLIQALQSAFEHDAIRILNNPVLIGELQAYESKRTASGFSYSAPSGMHDDTVMALAFAWHAGQSEPALL
jgi:hypothetical protein